MTDYVESANKLRDETDQLARDMLDEMLLDETVSGLARRLGVNKGLIPYVLGGGHSPTVLTALGLPVYQKVEVPVCPECGIVHSMHRTCTEKKRVQERHRKVADLESEMDLETLDNVARYFGFPRWTPFCRWIAWAYNTVDSPHNHDFAYLFVERKEDVDSDYGDVTEW